MEILGRERLAYVTKGVNQWGGEKRMLRIGVCDDNEKDRERIEAALFQIELQLKECFEIKTFHSGEELCVHIIRERYDLILLDIQMKGIDGIETLKRIQKLNVDSYIIFISSYDERIRELFAEKVIGFIQKPLGIRLLEQKIISVMKSLEEQKIFTYTKYGVDYIVRINDIQCFESNKHYVVLYTRYERVEFKGKLADVWSIIQQYKSFAMPHRSFIVNFDYVRYISRQEMEFYTFDDSCVRISISRIYKKDTTSRLQVYVKKIGQHHG
ncbi:MAG: LytTR family DNA-binding domain-containing protein [Eubacteriales bacterium]